jgi:hypothetical protein
VTKQRDRRRSSAAGPPHAGSSPLGKGTPGSGLLKRNTLEDVDLGLAFLPEFEGKGFGFEAAAATLGYG